MSVITLQRILKKGNCAVSVYEALSLMIAFATLIVLVNNKDNKKIAVLTLAELTAIKKLLNG